MPKNSLSGEKTYPVASKFMENIRPEEAPQWVLSAIGLGGNIKPHVFYPEKDPLPEKMKLLAEPLFKNWREINGTLIKYYQLR